MTGNRTYERKEEKDERKRGESGRKGGMDRRGETIGKASPHSSFFFNSALIHSVKQEKVALDGSVECCAPPPRWCDLEL